MSDEWTLQLPDDVSQELESLDESRVNTVVSEALREALDLVESAEAKRESLHTRRRGNGRDREELAEATSEEPQTEAEKRQAELHQKRREGR